MYSKTNGIKSVHVDWNKLYKTGTPQYNVRVTREDGSVTTKIMYEKEIRIHYAKYLPKKTDVAIAAQPETKANDEHSEHALSTSPRM